MKTERMRVRLEICGAVQGVGFRPFVYSLAHSLQLAGLVRNSASGVCIEAEGGPEALSQFRARLHSEAPPSAQIQSIDEVPVRSEGTSGFQIAASAEAGPRTVQVLPDLAVCRACVRELRDPSNRRYRYPFVNCTHCGPRFSIIEGLPYDRSRTTMRSFQMCADCRREYADPADRRFHAQPNACTACGPHAALWDGAGRSVAGRDEALRQAVRAVRAGKILALKGLGGFQLLADARNEDAVAELRRRKLRPSKPLAVLFPDLESLQRACRCSPDEAKLLAPPAAPIVLLDRLNSGADNLICASVAPGNPALGAMLPCTPLHLLLLDELNFPVVATSGNVSEEPVCTDEREALERLRGIADLFLVHNRPIARHMDDSVARAVCGGVQVLRAGRGTAPVSVSCGRVLPSVVAVGGHSKNALAVTAGAAVIVGPHIGDLDSPLAREAFLQAEKSLRKLYALQPETIACDAHPGYFSARHARSGPVPAAAVQHHHAHLAACMAEHNLSGCVLGAVWDGTGFGADGTIWGGEFLVAGRKAFRRAARLRTFRLPGGEEAVREPRRSALGLLHEVFREDAFEDALLAPVRSSSPEELRVWLGMLRSGINSPVTSSMGRLFDGVAALANVKQTASFEGEAAMALEYSGAGHWHEPGYSFEIRPGAPGWVVDWEPMLRAVIGDCRAACPAGLISARFHNGLAEALVSVARLVGIRRVVLAGGCFQNRYLLERSVLRLRAEGFVPFWPQRVPPNDGGIALGQAVVAASRGG